MGGGFGGSVSKSEPVDMTPLKFAELRGPVAAGIRGGINPNYSPFNYAGPYAAQIGQGEQSALDYARYSGGPGGDFSGAGSTQLLNDTIGGQYLSAESNPFLQSYIDAAIRPIQQQAEQAGMDQRALFTQAGHKVQGDNSSPFAKARGDLQRDTMQAMGDTTSQIATQAYQAERANQLQAVNQATATQAARFQNAMGALEASALPRMVAQLGIDGGREEFNRRMKMIEEMLSIGANVASPHLGTKSVSVQGEVSAGYG